MFSDLPQIYQDIYDSGLPQRIPFDPTWENHKIWCDLSDLLWQSDWWMFALGSWARCMHHEYLKFPKG